MESYMGTWAIDAFGNDDAGDWAYGLEDIKDFSLIEETLDKVLASKGEYLEAPDSAEALAAIEVIARLQGNWGLRNAYTKTVDSWVSETGLVPSAALCKTAHEVIDLILGEQSELNELWQESEEHSDWVASVLELKSRVHT
jgi:Domain of unknown function (DUF4259)